MFIIQISHKHIMINRVAGTDGTGLEGRTEAPFCPHERRQIVVLVRARSPATGSIGETLAERGNATEREAPSTAERPQWAARALMLRAAHGVGG